MPPLTSAIFAAARADGFPRAHPGHRRSPLQTAVLIWSASRVGLDPLGDLLFQRVSLPFRNGAGSPAGFRRRGAAPRSARFSTSANFASKSLRTGSRRSKMPCNLQKSLDRVRPAMSASLSRRRLALPMQSANCGPLAPAHRHRVPGSARRRSPRIEAPAAHARRASSASISVCLALLRLRCSPEWLRSSIERRPSQGPWHDVEPACLMFSISLS